MRRMGSMITRLAPLVLVAASSVARAEGLEFVPPDGFLVIERDGQATPDAKRSPEVAALVQPGLKLFAVKLEEDLKVGATFQVMVKNRPSTFNASTLDRFTDELAGEMAQGGMMPKIVHKDVIEIAGRQCGRVALSSEKRKLMFIGIPDGPRTALLLYAASERDFGSLFDSFDRSSRATHVSSQAEPGAPPQQPPRETPAQAESGPAASEGSTWIAVGALAGVVAIVLVAALITRRSRRAAPAKRGARRG
jgi:hypothetical protein